MIFSPINCSPLAGDGALGRHALAGRVMGSPVASSTLNDGLVSFWTLNEESGTRADSVGSNDLTDNNTVGFDTGKVGNAALFVNANSESLSVAHNSDLTGGGKSFSFAGWIYLQTSGFWSLVNKGSTDESAREYLLLFNNTGSKLTWHVVGTGDAQTALDASTAGALSTETWYFVYCYHDASAQEIGISVNNGTVDTAAHTAGCRALVGQPFAMGVADTSWYFNGRLDAWGRWDRVLTAAEVAELYNSGSGKEYPF